MSREQPCPAPVHPKNKAFASKAPPVPLPAGIWPQGAVPPRAVPCTEKHSHAQGRGFGAGDALTESVPLLMGTSDRRTEVHFWLQAVFRNCPQVFACVSCLGRLSDGEVACVINTPILGGDFSWVLLLRRGRNTQQRVGLSPAHLHPAKTLYNGTRLLPTLEGGSAAETWRGLDNVSEQGFHCPLQGSLTPAAGREHGVPNLACGHALPAGCSGRWPRALLPAGSTCLFAFTGMRGGINDSPGRCCQGSCNK